MRLNVLIPTFNEANTITKVLEQTYSVLNKNKKQYKNIKKFIILILDDSSTDNSEIKIKKYINNKNNNKIIFKYKKTKKNVGKSTLIFNEIKKLNKNDIIFITDGDIELPSKNIKLFLDNFFSKNVEVICGVRKLNANNQAFYDYIFYLIGIKFSNFLINFGFKNKIEDIHCGQKMFKFMKFPVFFCFRFSIDTELALYFLKQNKKKINLLLDNYKRRSLEEGKKLKFFNGVSLIFQTILIKFLSIFR